MSELTLLFSFYEGKPENAQIGIMNQNDPLPLSIDGLYMSMLNHSAKKARLTFKLELDELWINTGKYVNNDLLSMQSVMIRRISNMKSLSEKL